MTHSTPRGLPLLRLASLPWMLLIALGGAAGPVCASDWPTYQRDYSRSASSPDPLPARMHQAWSWSSRHRPQPAWQGEAKWDGWNKVYRMKARQTFDRAFHPIVAAGRVYFGSSADDKIYCLDAATGRELWSVFTEGPVRFAPTFQNGRLYAGSDDGCVYCLDAATGQRVWKERVAPADRRIPGNGRVISAWPVRTSVVVLDNLVYTSAGMFPSEGVFLVALDADTGALRWRQVQNDLPAQGYLAASATRLYVPAGRNNPIVCDRANGNRLRVVDGAGGTYALLAGDTLVFGPGKTGQLGTVEDGAKDQVATFEGNHMIITPSRSFLHSDTGLSALDRTRYLELIKQRRKLGSEQKELSARVATLAKQPGTESAQQELRNQAAQIGTQIDAASKGMEECVRWRTETRWPFSLILAGQTLIAGGVNEVAALDADRGSLLWTQPVQGDAYGLATANGDLLVSTDAGVLHCFRSGTGDAGPRDSTRPAPEPDTLEAWVPASRAATPGVVPTAPVLERALRADSLALPAETPAPAANSGQPEPGSFQPSYGPFIDWVDRTTATVTWETAESVPTMLELASPSGKLTRFGANASTRTHELRLSGLARDTEYRFRLRAPDRDGREHATRRYIFDTSFHYQPAAVPAAAGTNPEAGSGARPADPQPDAAARASGLLKLAGITQGWALLLGAEDARLAIEIVRQSDLKLLIVERDEARVKEMRRALDEANVYGVRASVQHVTAGQLPHGSFLANLIGFPSSWRSGQPPGWPAAEVFRVLRPAGGAALLGTPPGWPADRADATAWRRWLANSEMAGSAPERTEGFWLRYQRGRLAGAGDWTHQYGNADNTSTSLDEHVQGDLQVGWWGDPGPRPMPDRGPRNPAPLSANGRLYIQGDRILFGLDAYNGSILWSVIAPGIRRANLPRDCSNMAADDTGLYVAHRRYCVAFDGQTGARRTRFELPDAGDGRSFDWGYVAAAGPHLLGTRVKQGSQYQGDDGEWFEDFKPKEISRVTSEALFALDPTSGSRRWIYQRGAILNSTITIGDGMIFFIESRNPAAVNAPTGRLGPELLTDTHLVALDLRTGTQLWEAAQDISKLQFMTYLVYSRNTLVTTGTDQSKTFHTSAYSAPAPGGTEVAALPRGGELLWSESHKEGKGHHSGHLQHPVVLDGVFYSDQRAFDLKTGKTLRTDLPERRGCGTMSAARNAIFFRHNFQGMWDLKSNRRTQFEGIRSGCWIGLIPAGGMLLAPETSAGCSCTFSIQTSMGYTPRSLDAPSAR